jgi:hypothetical protein
MKPISLLVSILYVCVLATAQDANLDPYFAEKHVSLVDGARLYGWCRATPETVPPSPESGDTLAFPLGQGGLDAALCYGYVGAIVDSMPLGDPYFMPDPTVRLSQYVAVVMPYLHDHPKLSDKPAARLVHIALHQKFLNVHHEYFAGQSGGSHTYAEKHVVLFDGAQLYGWCKATEGIQPSPESDSTMIFPVGRAGQSAGWCYGYVSAIADSMLLSKRYFSPDAKVQLTQYVSVVTLYLHDHPELWDKPAASLVQIALHEKFGRCRHC